jgi:hypothetical protein
MTIHASRRTGRKELLAGLLCHRESDPGDPGATPLLTTLLTGEACKQGVEIKCPHGINGTLPGAFVAQAPDTGILVAVQGGRDTGCPDGLCDLECCGRRVFRGRLLHSVSFGPAD